MTNESIYRQLGIDAQKSTVREIFSRIVDNDFPGAFVNIKRDPEFPGYVFTKHPDGDGSKFLQRLLHMEETGDTSIIRGAVDDAFEMNFGDIAASGFVSGKIVLTQIIDINAFKVGKEEVMQQIALRVAELLKIYRDNGFDLTFFMGGETADLPNQTSSVIYNADVYARAQEKDLITGANIRPGDRIYGFASFGQAVWEDEYNYGLMSNGATQARLYLMSDEYNEKYPHLVGYGKRYKGRYRVASRLPTDANISISKAILSPTRNWSLVIKILINKLKERGLFDKLHGISMNTGGGATKIGHLGRGITYYKEMPEPPDLFQMINFESNGYWESMFESFNCGIGIDIVGEDDPELEEVLMEVEKETKIQLFELGVCEPNTDPEKNKVILETPFGIFDNY